MPTKFAACRRRSHPIARKSSSVGARRWRVSCYVRQAMKVLRLALALCLFVTACDADTGPTGEQELSCEATTAAWPENLRALDIVLVIDDSASMAEHQAKLAANLPRLAWVLENVEGGLPSVHVAVVSASAASGHLFESTPRQDGCTVPNGDFIVDSQLQWWTCSDSPLERCGERNYEGTLGETLACIGLLGAEGGEDQQLFEAALSAVDGSVQGNGGFLREHAGLVIVFISDTDDASPGTPADYAAALKAIKRDPGLVVVTTVRANAAPRLAAFEAEFPQRNDSASFAGEDWSDAFEIIANLFVEVLGRPCLGDVVDTTDVQDDNPGLQPECVVTGHDAVTGAEYVIPACRMLAPQRPHPETALPCWWLEQVDWSDECGYVPTVEVNAPYTVGWPEVRCVGTCE